MLMYLDASQQSVYFGCVDLWSKYCLCVLSSYIETNEKMQHVIYKIEKQCLK